MDRLNKNNQRKGMGRTVIHLSEDKVEEVKAAAPPAAEFIVMDSPQSVVDALTLSENVIDAWHVYADARVYGFYCKPSSPDVVGRSQWEQLQPVFNSESKVFLHTPYAEQWLAPHLARVWRVSVHATQADQWFYPEEEIVDSSYDACAELYDAAFEDMRVRKLEWDYITSRLKQWREQQGRSPKVVEIGCGNGQMLAQLHELGYIDAAIGYDASAGMIACAQKRQGANSALEFKQIMGPKLPSTDQSADVVISFMSFRYLDWGAICAEIQRVLKPQGMFMMIDMAETVLEKEDAMAYQETKRRDAAIQQENPHFKPALTTLVKHEKWKDMLELNPKEQAHAYEAFLTDCFPAGKWERLYVCYDHSLFGFTTTISV